MRYTRSRHAAASMSLQTDANNKITLERCSIQFVCCLLFEKKKAVAFVLLKTTYACCFQIKERHCDITSRHLKYTRFKLQYTVPPTPILTCSFRLVHRLNHLVNNASEITKIHDDVRITMGTLHCDKKQTKNEDEKSCSSHFEVSTYW